MTPTRGQLVDCAICGGFGSAGFHEGPVVELCSTCGGTGRIYSDGEDRGLFAALLAEGGPATEPGMRLLLRGLASLEERIARLERTARS